VGEGCDDRERGESEENVMQNVEQNGRGKGAKRGADVETDVEGNGWEKRGGRGTGCRVEWWGKSRMLRRMSSKILEKC
jgi:hypothetical protein